MLNGTVCTIDAGTYTEDMTWISDYDYVLGGAVFIGDGSDETKLTIQADTTIYGDVNAKSVLVIQRNSKIFANGTAENPITFTSSKAPGSREPGDWGGVVINGNAVSNAGTNLDGEAETGKYGGTDDADNSGVFKYVRIQFAGYKIDPENELNGLALQGVGSGTEIHHVHIHKTSDDSIEFFGGAAQVHHMVLTACQDDSFDWTQGWHGKAQYVVIQQQNLAEVDRGIEGDNWSDDNAATPVADPELYNFTLVGESAADGTKGMKIREGTHGTFRNFIIMNFNSATIDIDHDLTWDAILDGTTTIDYSIVDQDMFADDEEEPGLVSDWWATGSNNAIVDPDLVDPTSYTAPNFAPKAGSPALGAGTGGGFVDDADFIGAVGQDDWTTGWTDYPEN